MNKILLSFILTSIAGLSTILGYFIIYIKGNKIKIFLLITFLLGMFLSYYISLKVEKEYSNSLKKIEIISMLAIILHNIPEDCSCYASQLKYNIGLKQKLPR